MFFNQKICEHIAQVLDTNNGCGIIIGLLGSWIITIFFGWFFVKHSIEYLQNIAKLNFEEKYSKAKYPSIYKKWIYWGQGNLFGKPNLWLGLFEVTLFYICLLVNKPEGIGAWLVFKVAAKWQSWATIVKFPDKIAKIKDFIYIQLRNDLATSVLQRFLIGTILNIMVAFIGVAIFFMIRISLIAEKSTQGSWPIVGVWIIGLILVLIFMYIFKLRVIDKLPKDKKEIG